MQIYNEFNVNNSIYEKQSHVIKACKDKLEKYLFNGGMPSMNLFKSIRILDPLYFKLNNVNFDNLQKILMISEVLLMKFQNMN